MSATCRVLKSSIGRKFLMALTGIALLGFLIMHLAGNLTLLSPDASLFNGYAHSLESMGSLLIVAEVGLALMFVAHIVLAILVTIQNRRARGPVPYLSPQSKGGPSHWSPASRMMPVTGAFILLFLIIHIIQFKFGPSIAEGYVATVDGHEVRDLHRLVAECFSNPVTVGFYVVAMIALAAHLRHGFWSLFQSLGVAMPAWSRCLYLKSAVIALIIAGGFMAIPIALFFSWAGGR